MTKKLGKALPPPHLDKIQKNSYFFRETVPYIPQMNNNKIFGIWGGGIRAS